MKKSKNSYAPNPKRAPFLTLEIKKAVPKGDSEAILQDLQNIQLEFCKGLSLTQIWEQEKPYYQKHGMSAFDCGYVGLTL